MPNNNAKSPKERTINICDAAPFAMPSPITTVARRAAKRAARIAALNDQLRQHGRGGSIVMTRGVSDLDAAIRQRVIVAVRDFTAFSTRNDPYGEHDCAVIEVEGVRVIWKIDAYDRSITLASADPTDPKITHRVLTIMLADEY